MADDDDELMVDILDRAGRLKRFFVSFAVGVAVVVLVGSAMYGYIRPDEAMNGRYTNRGAWRTIFYVSGIAGAVAGTIVWSLLSWLKQRRDLANVIPRARVKR